MKSFDNVVQDFNKKLAIDKSFDLIYRTITIGDRRAVFYFIDGMLKDDIVEKLLEVFQKVQPESFPGDAHGFAKQVISYVEANLETDEDVLIHELLKGVLLLYIEGYQQWITIDCRTYPARGVQEPDKDKALRGSRDGFVETINFNTALIRRRIRSPQLRMEIFSVGESTQTDVVLCYMEDRVDPVFLKNIKQRVQDIQVDSLVMNQQSLAEALYTSRWLNPFPKVKYSERPDTASASILEGNIVILVDNSPSAMIMPTSVFDVTEEANDYYFPPITGTYLRLSRFLITLVTLLLTPVFLLFMQNQEWIPEAFSFVIVRDPIHIPLLAQLLILELAIDGMRLAALNTPSILTTPLSVIAALVLGEFSVNSGWFNSEVMLYMAFVAVANYSQSSYEFGYALKFMRILLLILVALFNFWGFLAGCLLVICSLAFNHTISGKSYLYPLIPFHWKKLKYRILRAHLKN